MTTMFMQRETDCSISPGHHGLHNRIEKYGFGSLSDCELLDLLCFEGSEGKAAEVLQKFGSLNAILEASLNTFLRAWELGQCSSGKDGGLPPNIFIHLRLAQEINSRVLLEKLRERPLLSSSKTLHEYLRATMAGEQREQFRILFLDSQLRLIQSEVINDGTISECVVYPREVVRRALEVGAHAMILVHNHPAHTCKASERDCSFTRTIVTAAAALDIVVPDHLIVAGEEIVSMHELHPSCFSNPWSKSGATLRIAPVSKTRQLT